MAATITVDGNEAVASVAYRLNELIALYPITPASPMGEWCDEWAASGRPNLAGQVPQVVEMQSEAGAAGVVHGALQAGALATSFTASQGLLLMIPELYKIAGELIPFCLHVAARTVATHALSIFGDHSDVMACRQTGMALLASGSVQEAQDFACIAHAAALRSRVPFLHFFDGFRTSHEVSKIRPLTNEDLRFMTPEEGVRAHRARALSPDHPTVRGTAQNPDVFFQAREACTPFYDRCPSIVEAVMARFVDRTGRRYRLFEYAGHPEAEHVLVMMGSGAETAHETVDWLVKGGRRVGLVKVRLYRPFSPHHLLEALPPSTRSVTVLDRTKEPGSPGEPLFLDVTAALRGRPIRVTGGRYGLSSKEFTPAMAKAVFDHSGWDRFTVGILDDVSYSSLPVDPDFDIEPDDVYRALFFGLGADGTVGANKNSIKIIGEETDAFAQGYFVYDSKKSGALTVSHLRFGPRPIRIAALVRRAHFVACHQFGLLERLDVLERAAEGAVVLLNGPATWDRLPREFQEQVLEKRLSVWAIDANRLAREMGLGGRINTIMQACFFALSKILPPDRALEKIKEGIRKSYGRKGEELVERNERAVDAAAARLQRVEVPDHVTSLPRPPTVPADAPDFIRRVTARIMEGHGDLLPVSAFPVDGTWPVGTSRWEKRNLAEEIPAWEPELCVQCNKCALICPHAALRVKLVEPARLAEAPPSFRFMPFRSKEDGGLQYAIQVAPEDCTGCGLCVQICPGRDKAVPERRSLAMVPQPEIRRREAENFAFFLGLPETDRTLVTPDNKGSQFFEPLFEFSGACTACGETPYVKLLTQLFGDRLLIANATGCSSIYGGNLPTTPYAANREGRGPAWCNSLFEDNAEFGLGLKLAVEGRERRARSLLQALEPSAEILGADQSTEAGIQAQRRRVEELRARLADRPEAAELLAAADDLVRKSVWIVGGDGWAYDIGYGGLDHVLSMPREVRILVLDTEVYSNTGGQQSKATPMAATARFAAAGKSGGKKDLGLMAMSYGHAYVAQVALGARDQQTVQAFVEAESFPGPALILAYCPCIAHGYDLGMGLQQQKRAVDSGAWPLYRYDPRRAARGEPALKLDSPPPKISLEEFMQAEARFRGPDPERSRRLREAAAEAARRRLELYRHLAGLTEVRTFKPAVP